MLESAMMGVALQRAGVWGGGGLVHSLFAALCQDAIVTQGPQASKLLPEEYAVVHRDCAVGLHAAGCLQNTRMRLTWFEKGQGGWHYWWGLKAVIAGAALPSRRGRHRTHPWRFLQQRWKSWERLVADCHLPPPRLPMRIKSVADQAAVDIRPEEMVDGRVLDRPTCTTAFLVAAISRMAFAKRASGGCMCALASEACMLFLRSLSRRTALTELRLVVNRELTMHPSGYLQTNDHDWAISLPVHDCFVDLRPLRAWASEHRHERFSADAVSMSDYLHVSELFRRFWCAGKPTWRLLVQLIHFVGRSLDSILDEERARLDRESCPADAPLHLRRHEADGIDTYQQQLACVKYLISGRRAFEKQRVFSFATDASRVAYRGRQNLAFALPSNIVVWAPPQALVVDWSGAQGNSWGRTGFEQPVFLLCRGSLFLYRVLSAGAFCSNVSHDSLSAEIHRICLAGFIEPFVSSPTLLF